MKLRTPLSKVHGLGSAKEGVHHWWAQRLTAIALVPLCLWFVFELITMTAMDYQAVTAWMQSPVITVLLILLIFSLFYHAQLGVQVVIEDYVGCKVIRVTSLILLKFTVLFAGLIAAVAVLKVFLGL